MCHLPCGVMQASVMDLLDRLAVTMIERVFAADSWFKRRAGLAESTVGFVIEIEDVGDR